MGGRKREKVIVTPSSLSTGVRRARRRAPEAYDFRRAGREERKKILEAERGKVIKRGSYPLEVALVYPNTYELGMSNLGYQYIYHLFNSSEKVRCERFFWDPGFLWPSNEQPVSLEGGRRLTSFSLVAFSVSFENDYANIVGTLVASGIEPEADLRGEETPGFRAGGPCAFMRPEPLAPIVDLFALGGGEVLIPTIIEKWLEVIAGSSGSKLDFLEAMAGEEGFYVPRFLDMKCYPGGNVKSFRYMGEENRRVKGVWSELYGKNVPRLLSPYSHFAEMPLVEIGMGCSRGCRFCVASFIYRPPRKRDPDEVKRDIDRLLPIGNGRIGLVGSALSDYPGLIEVLEHIWRRGGEVGLSSFRMDGVNAEVLALLSRLGVRTLTCAVEAGSQRMREIIRKSLSEDEILRSIQAIGRKRLGMLKLYFMVGLPYERDEDVEAIIDLVRKIKGVIKPYQPGTRISLKVNPFIPKPFTPFQWSPLERKEVLRKKIGYLIKNLKGTEDIALKVGSLRKAVDQAILSRGDRRLAMCIVAAAKGGFSLQASMKRAGIDSHFYLYRDRPKEEIFPWDFIDYGFKKERLLREYQRAGKIASGRFDQST